MDLYLKNLQKTCPVSTLRKYLRGLKLSPSSDDYIVKLFATGKRRTSIFQEKKNTIRPLSYSQTRKIVLEAFEKIGLPRNKFGLHSLRSEEASSAANIGVKDRLFKKHGRWKSQKAKD